MTFTALPNPVAGEPVATDAGRMTANWFRNLFNLFARVNALSVIPQIQTSGSVTVTGLATTGTATFAVAQASNTYSLLLTQTALTGAPAVSVIRSIAKTTTGITVTVSLAPGVGTSVTFDYVVIS